MAPLLLYPRFVLATREAVSLLLGQWLEGQPPTHSSTIVGTTSRARSILSTLDGKRLLAVAFNHDALGAPPVDLAELHFLNLVARFDILDYLCQYPPFPFILGRWPKAASIQRRSQGTATRRATATTMLESAASVILPAGGPRIAQSAHRRTKPQMPCSDGFRSASVSYRLTLAAAGLCNSLAPALSCRPAHLQSALSSPSTSGCSLPLGAPFGRVGLQVAPGMIAFVLRTSF